MNKSRTAAVAAAIALAFSAGAMADMKNADYKAARGKIAADYKAAKAACAPLSANAKDICAAEAKGSEQVARAELEAANKPGSKTRYDVSIAKADAEYAVAREKCDDKAAADKTSCVKDAKAAAARAKADAKAELKAPSAGKPAQAAAAPAPGKESPGAYLDDSVITAKVKAAILEEPTLKSAEINVETSKGRVQLSGFVGSRADIAKAVQVAKRVNGVKSVKNDMILKGTQ
jgi:osmotically-inducible protein OsmY